MSEPVYAVLDELWDKPQGHDYTAMARLLMDQRLSRHEGALRKAYAAGTGLTVHEWTEYNREKQVMTYRMDYFLSKDPVPCLIGSMAAWHWDAHEIVRAVERAGVRLGKD